MRALLKGIAAAITLAALLVGLPFLLVRFGDWPVHGIPSLQSVRQAPHQVLTDDAVFSILTVSAWLVWLAFAASVVLEAAAAVGGLRHVRLPFSSPFQAGARHLVGAVLLTTTLTAHGGGRLPSPPLPATTTLPAPTPRSVAAPPTTSPTSPSADMGKIAQAKAPITRPPSPTAPLPPPATEAGAIVTVAPGDSPWSIAERHLGDGMRWRELWDLNRSTPQADGSLWVEPQHIMVGWKLRLPNSTSIANTPGLPPQASESTAYVVRPGDTLAAIARVHLGDAAKADAIFEANAGSAQPDGRQLTDPNLILPGWRLVMPEPAAAAPPSPQPPSVPTPPGPPSPATANIEPAVPGVPPEQTPASQADEGVSSTTTASPPATTDPAAPAPEVGRRRPQHEEPHRATEMLPASAPAVLGVTGAVVLATSVAEVILRQRRHAAERGTRRVAVAESPPAPTERAVVAASDLPLVRWAGQMLSELLGRLDVDGLHAVPVAAELSEEHGLEVLWSGPVDGAPEPWTAIEDGWSWLLPYDAEAPTPADALPARLPALVTVGQRDGRQLLLNLEQLGSLGLSGPPDRTAALLRSIASELALGEELSDAYLVLVGAPLTMPELTGSRGEHVSAAEAVARLASARKAVEEACGSEGTGAFAYRAGPDAPHVEAVVAIAAGASLAEARELVEVTAPDCGVAAVLDDPAGECPSRIELRDDGAVLQPLGLEFDPVQLPQRTATDVAELLRGEPVAESPDGSQPGAAPKDLEPRVVTAPLPDVPIEPAALPFVDDAHDESRPRPEVFVRVLGQPRVDGRGPLGERQLSLTAFLAVLGRPATPSDVVEAIWGGREVQARTVWNLVSRTRRALGTLSSGEAVLPVAEQSQRTYSLHPSVVTDLDVLRGAYRMAEAEPDEGSVAELDRALDLVEGRPFGTAGFGWAFGDGQYGTEACQLIESAALLVARLACEAGGVEMARHALLRGLHGLPGNEALYRARMQLEADAGNTAGVQAAYKELVHHLLEFDETPSRETIDLRLTLRNRNEGQVPV